jgi:hypothetical protein
MSKVETQAIEDLADQFMDRGMKPDEAVAEIVEVLDTLIPLAALGPFGAALEALDGPAIKAIVMAVSQIRADPEKRALRKQARIKRRAERKAARDRKKNE